VLQKFDSRNRDLIVNINGRLVHREQAGVSPFDSAVQGGDAVWEGLRLYCGRIFRLEQHLDRLVGSAKALAFSDIPPRERIVEEIRRTLEANGYEVVSVADQACCGALHEHAGDRPAAEALARSNVASLEGAADYIVVNSAGCGALLKDYGHLLGEDSARRTAAKVRDVSELLAAAGPRHGGELPVEVAYDAPCHLQHAQGVQDAPLAVLRAIPGLRLRILPGSDKCCGSAGIYSVLQPDMARSVLEDKIDVFRTAAPRPRIVATGNPGCLMQIGAGLRAADLDIAVAHPVELLDESYRRGGMYERREE